MLWWLTAAFISGQGETVIERLGTIRLNCNPIKKKKKMLDFIFSFCFQSCKVVGNYFFLLVGVGCFFFKFIYFLNCWKNESRLVLFLLTSVFINNSFCLKT